MRTAQAQERSISYKRGGCSTQPTMTWWRGAKQLCGCACGRGFESSFGHIFFSGFLVSLEPCGSCSSGMQWTRSSVAGPTSQFDGG